MNYLSLFSGAGGGDLAFQHLLGFKCVGYVEYENYCQRLIRQRIEDGLLDAAPIFGDIRRFNSEGYAESYQGLVDVVSGGFPCQDISCAGKGAGLEGERSGLWFEMEAIIRTIRPRYVFIENSTRLLVLGFDRIVCGLSEMGYNASWGIVSASDVGAPHLRKRLWALFSIDISYTTSIRQQKSCFNLHQFKKSEIYGKTWNGKRVDQPGIVGVVDGVAYQMDRLKAAGNGQVPIVAATAFRILSGLK